MEVICWQFCPIYIFMLNRNCFKGGLGDGPMILKPSTNSAASFVGKSKQYDDNFLWEKFLSWTWSLPKIVFFFLWSWVWHLQKTLHTLFVKIKWFVIQREIGANYFTWHDRDERSSSLGVLIPLELLEDFNVCWIISGNSSVWEEDSQTLEMKEMSCPDSLRWTFLSWQVIFKSKMWKCEDEVQQSLLT